MDKEEVLRLKQNWERLQAVADRLARDSKVATKRAEIAWKVYKKVKDEENADEQ